MKLAIEPLSKFRKTQIAAKFFLNNVKKVYKKITVVLSLVIICHSTM